jgi:hypothetical protein
MKSTSKSVLMLLLAGCSAQSMQDQDMVQLDAQQSLTLGSLEGAYLAQKQLMKERQFKWDTQVLGVVNASDYASEEKDSLEEQHVDIEFSQKNTIPEESWKDAPVSKPQENLAQKKVVAHKKEKAAEPVAEAPGSKEVKRSNIAEVASKFEEETRDFNA